MVIPELLKHFVFGVVDLAEAHGMELPLIVVMTSFLAHLLSNSVYVVPKISI